MKKGLLAILLLCLALALAGCACKHENTQLVGAKEPTCTEEGYTGDVFCAVCGELLTQGEAIPALGHEPGETVGAVEPTCTEEGYSGDVVCAVCGEVLTQGEAVPALGHTPGEVSGAAEPTCLLAGYTGDSVCTVCGEELPGEPIEKLAHDFSGGVCTVCGWREPGLYAGEERVMSWEELVDNGYVEVEEGVLRRVIGSMYGTLVVSEDIVEIGYSGSLFGESSQLEGVLIPASVRVVRSDAFKDCASLQTARFFGPVDEIGGGAFENCTALREVRFDGPVGSFGYYVFQNCASLESFAFPEGSEAVPDYLLADCTSLTRVELPETVRVIKSDAFHGCASLEALELHEGLEVIGSNALTDTSLRELVLPSTVTEFGRQTIPTLTFADFSKAAILNFDADLSNCAALKTVLFPSCVESIGGYVLGGANQIEELELPDGVKEVDVNLLYFSGSASPLKRLVWPASLIDGSAFGPDYCPELEEIVYLGSEVQWSLTSSKDLFAGVTVTFAE